MRLKNDCVKKSHAQEASLSLQRSKKSKMLLSRRRHAFLELLEEANHRTGLENKGPTFKNTLLASVRERTCDGDLSRRNLASWLHSGEDRADFTRAPIPTRRIDLIAFQVSRQAQSICFSIRDHLLNPDSCLMETSNYETLQMHALRNWFG